MSTPINSPQGDLPLLVKPYVFPNQNITIENSVFGASNGYYSLDLTSSASIPNQAINLLNNTFSKGISVTRGVAYPGSQMIGNIVALSKSFCDVMLSDQWVVRSNLVVGASPCGELSRSTADPGLGADGYHLLPHSPALGAGDQETHPPYDIDGDFRPLNVAPDAGADQRETALIVPGRSIGDVSIGMTRDDVVTFYGEPAKTRPVASSTGGIDTVETYWIHGGRLTLTYRSGAVIGISTTSPFYTTVSGIGPGFAGRGWHPARPAPLDRLPAGVRGEVARCHGRIRRRRQAAAAHADRNGRRSTRAMLNLRNAAHPHRDS